VLQALESSRKVLVPLRDAAIDSIVLKLLNLVRLSDAILEVERHLVRPVLGPAEYNLLEVEAPGLLVVEAHGGNGAVLVTQGDALCKLVKHVIDITLTRDPPLELDLWMGSEVYFIVQAVRLGLGGDDNTRSLEDGSSIRASPGVDAQEGAQQAVHCAIESSAAMIVVRYHLNVASAPGKCAFCKLLEHGLVFKCSFFAGGMLELADLLREIIARNDDGSHVPKRHPGHLHQSLALFPKDGSGDVAHEAGIGVYDTNPPPHHAVGVYGLETIPDSEWNTEHKHK
jgi:hypothetical protein